MRRPSSGSCGFARARPVSLVLGVRSRGHSHTCLWWRVGFCLWLSLGGDTSVPSAKSQHLGSRCMHPLAIYSGGTRALNDVRSNWVRHRHFSNLGVLLLLEPSWITPITMGLTIHSSRTRFAGRLNSGVSLQRRFSWPAAPQASDSDYRTTPQALNLRTLGASATKAVRRRRRKARFAGQRSPLLVRDRSACRFGRLILVRQAFLAACGQRVLIAPGCTLTTRSSRNRFVALSPKPDRSGGSA
jgi:hypothetical protein